MSRWVTVVCKKPLKPYLTSGVLGAYQTLPGIYDSRRELQAPTHGIQLRLDDLHLGDLLMAECICRLDAGIVQFDLQEVHLLEFLPALDSLFV